jgi:2-succinyl-5-enolpyruvyl-6-hydroxy-3-cyclohexene-1-carboxylate synthase
MSRSAEARADDATALSQMLEARSAVDVAGDAGVAVALSPRRTDEDLAHARAPIPNRTALAPTLLVDELARSGVRHVCISPGSRSAPLVSALVAHGGLELWSHVDERSGGFFALGLARAARVPVAVVCTSGTAVANLLPAVVEAFHARVPLVVLTADRPPELRDCGAGQAIDQLGIFGTHVRWFCDLGTPDATLEAMRHVRSLACRAVATARGDTGGVPGPVHVNLPFREPLDPRPVPGDVPDALLSGPAGRGRDAAPWTTVARGRAAVDADALEDVAALLRAARRPLVVAGALDDDDPAIVPAVAGLCAALQAPLIAEVASNLRHGPAMQFLVEAHDAVVRAPACADTSGALRPDTIVRIGPVPTAKAFATWLADLDGVPQIVIDPAATWADPASIATHLLVGAPSVVCSSLAARLGARRAVAGGRREVEAGWCARWRSAGSRARAALDDACSSAASATFEAHAVAALAATLPEDALLYAGNSLAVRALDAFWPAAIGGPPRVLANRGANGIDGFVSSVLGAAAADPARPVVGVCGDLTFYHDLNGLLAARRHGVRALLVVLNNDGGGIFDHLPIAAHRDGYEEQFATPHGLDFRPVVEMYGCSFTRVTRRDDLASAIARGLDAPTTAVVELRFARDASLAAWTAARAAAVRAAEEDA